MKPQILVVDDEEGVRSFFKEFLTKKNFEVYTAARWSEAEKIIYTHSLDIILLDVQLPGKNGLDILREVKNKFPMIEIIVFSGKANITLAVEAIKLGAINFVEKSDPIEKILTVLENCIKIKSLKEENIVLKKIKNKEIKQLTGKSKSIQKINEAIFLAAKSNANVLITGENGSGKQIVAENIHYYSLQSSGNFIDVNCAAVPENLLESELFGYEKGAFTGAVQTTKGKFELANNGTLFLDEIGELTPVLQAKLLKAIENKSFSRLGSGEVIQINARIIAATNIEIEKEIEQNRFRKDLFYRLNVIHIHLPPLRERLEDIPLLIRDILKEIGKEEKEFTEEAIEFLSSYHWPGNVRELRNIVERAVIMTRNQKLIQKKDLIDYIQPHSFVPQDNKKKEEKWLSLKEFLSQQEKAYLEKVISQIPTQKEAAAILDIERTVLYRKLKKYGIIKQ